MRCLIASTLRLASLVPDLIVEAGEEQDFVSSVLDVVLECSETARLQISGERPESQSDDEHTTISYQMANENVQVVVPAEMKRKIINSWKDLGPAVLNQFEFEADEVEDTRCLLGRRVYPPGVIPEVFQVQARLIEADVRLKNFWSPDVLPGKEPFELVLADPPFGLNMHSSPKVVSKDSLLQQFLSVTLKQSL